ncbi:hypothetical protein SAMN05444006_11096 [Allgaiera indica]|nr:hypothetical protein SAMN05444006_11096 [Allgaiera indica]
MRWGAGLLMLFSIAGCGAQPAPAFFGAARAEVLRDGRQYVVYRKGDRVEVIRLGYARPGEHRAIRETMVSLVPQVTGCRLSDDASRGDSGEMRGRLVACKPGRWQLVAEGKD